MGERNGLSNLQRKSLSGYLFKISAALFVIGFVDGIFKKEFSLQIDILICGMALLFAWFAFKALPNDRKRRK